MSAKSIFLMTKSRIKISYNLRVYANVETGYKDGLNEEKQEKIDVKLVLELRYFPQMPMVGGQIQLECIILNTDFQGRLTLSV